MFGELLDESAAQAVIHRAWDLGVHTLDTSNVYGGGRAEELIGKIIGTRRDQIVLCTKVGFRVGDDPSTHAEALSGRLDHQERWKRGIAPHHQGLSRSHIIAAVEASLRRLRTDYLDLYQIHRWDTSIPIDETLRAMDDLVRSGKVRYLGCSNVRSWRLYEALWSSDRNSLSRFESMQVPYSLLDRNAELDTLPACTHAQVGVIAYSSLAGGVLSGAHINGIIPGSVLAQRPVYQTRFLSEDTRKRLERFSLLSERQNRSLATMALAVVLQQPAITAATVGIQHPAELDELVDAINRPLSADELTAVDEIFS